MRYISVLFFIVMLSVSPACGEGTRNTPGDDAADDSTEDVVKNPTGTQNPAQGPTNDPATGPTTDPTTNPTGDGPTADPTGDQPDEPTVSFTAFGDWGEEKYQTEPVANALKTYCTTSPCDFNMDTGDSFNAGPPSSVSDPRWKAEYQDVFGNIGLPFYAALGNHDVDGDEDGNEDFQVLIDYSKVDQTWHMPQEYYSFALPSGSPVVEFFVLNSGDFEFEDAENTWLQGALSKSVAVWKVLVTHVPVISNGIEHGDDDGGFNDELIPAICNKFDLVLSSHEHIFSHLSEDIGGCKINQFIVGTGGMEHYDYNGNDPRVHATGAFDGFGWFQIKNKSLTFKMVDTNGKVFYETGWEK